MRQLTDHVVNPANDRLKIEVLDEPGHGGASHLYRIDGFDSRTNPSAPGSPGYISGQTFLFQNGPIDADGNGVNGITHEALLAIVLDRLRSFNEGPYRCRENSLAITHIEEAMHWLQHRTLARMRRGVEGTHAV